MSKDNYNIDNILSEVKKRREENEKQIKEGVAEAVEEATEAEPVEEAAEENVAEDEFVPAEELPADEPIEEEPVAEEIVEEAEEEYVEVAELDDVKAQKRAKRKKRAKAIIITLLVLIVLVGGFGAIYFNGLLNDLLDNNTQVETEEDRWAGMDGNEENFTPIYETEASELSSLEDMQKMWYYNGTPCSKSKVLNVLLVGEDTRGTDIEDSGYRADSAIICSINVETKKITFTSVLRDAYAYYETEPGNAETGRHDKINAAMSNGDIHAYIHAVENLYKIDIDNYAIVNFTCFKKIVDVLGGVTIDITEREINEINRNYKNRYGGVQIEKDFEGDHGKMKLTGRQALAYCRIRYIDSDTVRADRQKTVLIQLFKQAKMASTSKLLKIVREMIPYVSTGFNKKEIVKIAKYALTEHWLEYETVMNSVPNANVKGGKYYGYWCWKCDFPQDAYNLQMLIYGKSSITLAHERPDIAKCPEHGYYSEGASRMWATITNNNYGEATTVPTTKEEDA